MKVAADGDHSRLAFDKPNTWSQKYNLVWDKLLGLNVFPPEVARKEVAYLQEGDAAATACRSTRAPGSPRPTGPSGPRPWPTTAADFEAIVSPIYDYLNETTARLPFVDSYVTDNAKSDGMHARPVIGGVFIKMLDDPATWKKWAGRDRRQARRLGPAADRRRRSPSSSRPPSDRPVAWRYTTARSRRTTGPGPASTTAAGSKAPAASARPGRPGIVVGTDLEHARHLAPPRVRRCPTRPTSPRPAPRCITTRTSRSTSTGPRGRGVGLRDDLSAVEIRAAAASGSSRRQVVLRRALPPDGRRAGVDVGLVDVEG